MNDVRKWIFGAFFGLFLFVGLMVSVAYISSCGLTLSCNRAAPKVERTSVPTLVPATLPVVTQQPLPTNAIPESSDQSSEENIARPSNPGGPGAAIDLTGNVDSGKQIFVDNCQRCHGLDGTGNVPNPGTDDTTVPPLNPIDDTLVSSDYKTFATNVDLFIEHGSTPGGTIPNLIMPTWGDTGALKPQQISDVIAYIISLNK